MILWNLERPTYRELDLKIRTARRLLEMKRWAPADPVKLVANFTDFDLALPNEQENALMKAVSEIRAEHYAGGRPPTKSYEPATAGAEMFAFVWDSKHFARRMYFKFSIRGQGAAQRLYVYSLHSSRPLGRGV